MYPKPGQARSRRIGLVALAVLGRAPKPRIEGVRHLPILANGVVAAVAVVVLVDSVQSDREMTTLGRRLFGSSTADVPYLSASLRGMTITPGPEVTSGPYA
jgi:hypothetical protein